MMTGDELREALRSEMAAATPPPPMSTATALSTARRVRIRRRAIWACIGTATAVLAIAGVAAFSIPGVSDGLNAAGWPFGVDGQPQGDRTARAGPRYEQGVRLLNETVAVAPAGYTAPENPADQPADQIPMRYHQAQFEERIDNVEIWGYMAWAAMTKGEQTGRLLVEVHTAGNQLSTQPCLLAQQFWGMTGECKTMTVGAAQVGVVVEPANDRRFDQWAAYRHPDGVVVFVAQSKSMVDGGRPELAELPFSVEQLATLAVDERFHLK